MAAIAQDPEQTYHPKDPAHFARRCSALIYIYLLLIQLVFLPDWLTVGNNCRHLPALVTEGTILQMLLHSNPYLRWLALILLLATFVGVVVLAPVEKTLGETIRLVYAHVAFTRAGMMGIYLCGVLGLIVAVTNSTRLQSWTQTIGWVSFALFLMGGIFSMFAQQASWGGIPISEPRVRTSLVVTAVAVIILLLNGWIPWTRVCGLLYSVLAVYVAWVIPRTPLVLHPADAGSGSPSAWIRLTFPILTALAMLLGLWIVSFLNYQKHYE